MAQAGEASPPNKIPTTLGWFREGVNWLVALSSSALVFGAGFYKDFASAAWFVKTPFVFGALCFFVTIVSGVLCFFWVNSYANEYEKLLFYGKELDKYSSAGDQVKRAEIEQRRKDADNRMESARSRFGSLYNIVMWAFSAGMLSLAVLLTAGVLWATPSPKKSEEPNKDLNRYVMALSAEHPTVGGKRHAHTFLINEKTGQLWQMVCLKGERVQFLRVEVEGIGGTKKPQ